MRRLAATNSRTQIRPAAHLTVETPDWACQTALVTGILAVRIAA